MPNQLRAVVIDDEINRSQTILTIWRGILKRVYNECYIQYFHGLDDVEGIFSGRPHIVVLDNVFPDASGRQKPNVGVNFIVDNKLLHSDTLFVLFTSRTFSIDILGYKFPNPDMLVTKTTLSNRDYQEYISKMLVSLLKRLPVGDITFPQAADVAGLACDRHVLRSILEQCLISVQSRDYEDAMLQVNLHRLDGGYSRSAVFKANIYGNRRFWNVPFALKVDSSKNVLEEVNRYNVFVRLQMPHDMRVDLLGTGSAGDFSGVLYTFAFGSTSSIASTTGRIKSGDFSPIDLVVEKIFLSDTIGWYKKPVIHKETVEQFYNNSTEYSPAKDSLRVSRLQNDLDEIFGNEACTADEESYNVDGIVVAHVRRFLRKFFDIYMPEVICHGDLNTNNIVIADTGAIAAIDFEYSGYDSIYKDFVSFEVSVRAYWNGEIFESAEDFRNVVHWEARLVNGNEPTNDHDIPALTSYYLLIKKIRDASRVCANRVGVSYDERVYALALSFHVLKLIGLGIWTKNQKIKLIACLMANCEFLQNTSL